MVKMGSCRWLMVVKKQRLAVAATKKKPTTGRLRVRGAMPGGAAYQRPRNWSNA